MDASKRFIGQTEPDKFIPQSNIVRRVMRRMVNNVAPWLRNNGFVYMYHDGPLAKNKPTDFTLAGRTLTDKFKYMEDLYSSETRRYIRRERGFLASIDGRFDNGAYKHRIMLEVETRAVATTREAGFDKGEERIGDFIYYTRSLEGEETDVGFYRKRPGQGDMLGEELINPHELKRRFGYPTCDVGICRVSNNGKYIAYTLSIEGGDRYICHVRSADNASLFHVIRSSNIISIEFGSGESFYYTECNDLNRPYRIMRLELRPGILSEPEEIFRDDDENYFVDIRRTKDSQFMVITSDSKQSGSVLVMPATYPKIPTELQPFLKGRKYVEVAGKDAWGWLEHHNGHFIMVTSKEAKNYKVVYARDEMVLNEGRSFAGWKELVPHDETRQITDVDIFKSHLVIFENIFGYERSQHIRVVDIRNGVHKAKDRTKDVLLHFPPMCQLTPGLNKNYDQNAFNFLFSSVTTPSRECVYSFDSTHTPEQVKRMAPMSLYTQRTHEMFSPWDYMWPYHMYRDTVEAHDGEQIPITICQKRDLFVDEITEYDPASNTPRMCLLYVYGSYGETPSLHFQTMPYLWMIRRRWVVAFAHVRGGGEKPGWAEAGKGRNKMNTIHDFVSCCKFLVDQGFTTPDKLVVAGNSAGAVPIAAAMNMYGNELFNMALLRAPFLDIVNTMMNPDLPLSLSEREDWGDPLNNREDLDYLMQYDPYYNLNPRVRYPSVIVSACADDDRVPAWNALKYVARMREIRMKHDIDPITEPCILRWNDRGGHYKWNDMVEVSEEIAFIIQRFDLPGTHAKTNDLDTMQQTHNYFNSGLMDHDDAQQTFLKWDTWEREKIDFITKMHTMKHEPNFRALTAKKENYYWHKTHEAYEPRGHSRAPE
jgi:protease II